MQKAHEQETAPAADELIAQQRLLVKRVIASPSFAKSERLSTFLSCVCEMTFSGKADQINEQKIGTAVFGRRPDYDSGADGIVRTQASRLRQRLDAYFTTEGADETIRIVLPRGGYIPHFEPRAIDADTPDIRERKVVIEPIDFAEVGQNATPATKGIVQHSVVSQFSRHLPWAISAVMALLLLATLLLQRRVDSPGQVVDSHPIWKRLFAKGHSTLIVPADSGLVFFSGLSKQTISLDHYIRGDYTSAVATSVDPTQAIQADAASRRYTSIVDLEIATRLSPVANDRGAKLTVRFARDLRPNDLKGTNAILLGASEANPWVQLFEQHMNFVLSDDFKARIFSVLNRSPQKGEPQRWDSAANDPQRRVFGVVALVPNLSGDGDVLILEGTSMSGTEAACNFVTDDAKLMPFLDGIRGPDGHIPHFEVLIETNNLGASAVDTAIVAWRTSK